MSIFTNEIKRLIFTVLGVSIFLLALVWVGSNYLTIANSLVHAFNTVTGQKTYDMVYSNNLDKSKTYLISIDTDQGVMTFQMDKDNTSNTTNNIYNLYKNDFYKGSTFIQKNDKYILLGKGGNPSYTNVKYSIKEEINAVNLNLDHIKVNQYTTVLKNVYDDSLLKANANISVKQFYESLGYSYQNNISTSIIKKGSLVMYSQEPGKFGNQFFISSVNSIPEIDGRMTKFGDIQSGQDVLDKIISTNPASLKLNSISISLR